MKQKATIEAKRHIRQTRVRMRLSGTAARPRLNVFRSLRGIYVQLIDDAKGKTLLSLHSKTADLAGFDTEGRAGKLAVAYALGQAIAKKAKDMNITSVVFDRAGYRYHGRVQAVAEGARAGGLEF